MTEEFAVLDAQSREDWEAWGRRNVEITDAGVTLATKATVDTDVFSVRGRAFDVTPSGALAVLGDADSLSIYDAETGSRSRLSLAGFEDADIGTPTAIAVTDDQILLFDPERRQVAAFSRRRRNLDWTAPLETDPTTVVGSNRCVYLLDSDRIRSVAGGTVTTVVSDLDTPLDISVAPDESLYVLTERADGPAVLRADADVGEFEEPVGVGLQFPERFRPTALTAQSAETLVVAGVTSDGTAQLRRCDTQAGTTATLTDADQSPSTLVSGPGGGTEPSLYLQASPGEEIRRLDQRFVSRKDTANTRYEGRLLGRFDAGTDGIEWHRLTLDVDHPSPDTRVDVSYYTSQERQPEGLDAIDGLTETHGRELRAAGVHGLWDLIEHTPAELTNVLPTTEPDRIARWIEAAQERIDGRFDQRTDVQQATDPSDLLLRDATGQRLNVRIRLVGRRERSPRLRAVQAYCPRQSYIRYLPEIYAQETDTAPFLSRFLSLFESVFADTEAKLAQATHYLDPQAIPFEHLPWLEEWLAVDIGTGWPEQARRNVLSRAPELYRTRGTRAGLVTLLGIYVDEVSFPERNWGRALVRIERRLETLVADGYLTSHEAAGEIESYRDLRDDQNDTSILFVEYDQVAGAADSENRGAYDRLVGHRRRFQLFLEPSAPERHRREIERISQWEAPAYTDASVTRLRSRFQLGEDTFLGVNTVCPSRVFELGASTLGHSTELEPEI